MFQTKQQNKSTIKNISMIKSLCSYFEIYLIQQLPNMSRAIKMQEEQFPIHSPSYDNAFFNHCLTSFYHQDSSDNIIQAKCTTQEVLSYLQNNIDICDTPYTEIMKIVHDNFAFQDIDLGLLKKKIMKTKNVLKRNRAKLRKNNIGNQRDYSSIVLITEQGNEWPKKQRNRISAQISRDRKKERVKQLEEMNKKLQQQCTIQKIQNQKLKENMQLQKSKGQTTSKISKMLIFLGIICLLGIIKDIFISKTDSQTSISQIPQQITNQPMKKDLSYLNHSEDKKKMIQIIEAPLLEIFEDQTLVGKLKSRLQCSFDDWPLVKYFLPSRLNKEIEEIKLAHF